MPDTAEDIDDRPTHKPNGQFAASNKWKMPPWRPGQSGHTARFTPGRLVTVCSEYVEERANEDKPLTWSSLAVHMGISYRALIKYRKGEHGKDKAGIVHVLDYMESLILAQREDRLESKEFATQGVIASLRHHHGWEDKKVIDVKQQQISVIIDPGSALGQRLEHNQAITIEQTVEQGAISQDSE